MAGCSHCRDGEDPNFSTDPCPVCRKTSNDWILEAAPPFTPEAMEAILVEILEPEEPEKPSPHFRCRACGTTEPPIPRTKGNGVFGPGGNVWTEYYSCSGCSAIFGDPEKWSLSPPRKPAIYPDITGVGFWGREREKEK